MFTNVEHWSLCFADNAQRLILVANVDGAWQFWSGLTLVHAVSLHVVSSMPRVHGICMRKSVCSSWSMLCSALTACSCIGFFVTRFPKHLFCQWPSRAFNVAQVTLRWRLFSRYSRRFIRSMAGTAHPWWILEFIMLAAWWSIFDGSGVGSGLAADALCTLLGVMGPWVVKRLVQVKYAAHQGRS